MHDFRHGRRPRPRRSTSARALESAAAGLVVAAVALGGCGRSTAGASAPSESPAAPPAQRVDPAIPQCVSDPAAPLAFTVSPGGTPEVAPEYVAAQHCRLRIVDVREPEELAGPLGAIEGVQSVPQRRVALVAAQWDPQAPLVVVCRSGRRSGRVVRQLQTLGFTRVASMTGGMLGWRAQGLPVVEGARLAHPEPVVVPAAARRSLGRDEIAAHVASRDHVRWTKAATLLLHGSQACVDGRDAHAIVGTPGGDAGELVLALATAERLAGRALPSAEVERIFDAYLEAFGHFYLHSDEHAVAAWLDAVAEVEPTAAPRGRASLGSLRQPPPSARGPLLELVAVPAHVGCGHVRLMLQHPEAYGVRPGLVDDVLRTFYRRLWEGHPALELVVLEGGHAESAVVTVETDHEVHAYSPIPLVSPRIGDTEVFVAHPSVARFVRRQNAAFLLEMVPSLAAGSDRFPDELERLAAQQLHATLDHLAPDLPRFSVRFFAASRDAQVVGPEASQ